MNCLNGQNGLGIGLMGQNLCSNPAVQLAKDALLDQGRRLFQKLKKKRKAKKAKKQQQKGGGLKKKPKRRVIRLPQRGAGRAKNNQKGRGIKRRVRRSKASKK